MKRLMKTGTRVLCAGLVLLSAVGWSCSRQDEPVMNDSPQANGAIAQARMYYESTAVPLTKTVADQTIAIKPLPREITPQWERAAATVLSDGTTAWVDVPIEAGITYTAVRGGAHHHEVGEECGHDHEAVQAVQKLTIYTASDGTKQSLIATIVPEPDRTAKFNDFSSADGLAGFSGFVSWHDLTGKLIRVSGYKNGMKTRSVEATEENHAAVLEIVDNAVLYPIISNNVQTKGFDDDPCPICHKTNCFYKYQASLHCTKCKNDITSCTCLRCNVCGNKGSFCTCTDPSSPSGEICRVCGRVNCPDHVQAPGTSSPVIIQEDILRAILGSSMTSEQLQRLLDGSYGIDQEYQNYGDEYKHGLYVPGYNNGRSTAFDNMKNYFVQNVRGYLFLTSESEMSERFYYLGMALHPIADHYILSQTRVDMLNFYSYNTPQNILTGPNIVPYTAYAKPGTEAVRYIFNAVQNLSRSASESEIEAIFDHWLDMTGAERP